MDTNDRAKPRQAQFEAAPKAEGDAPKAWWRRVAKRLSKMTFI